MYVAVTDLLIVLVVLQQLQGGLVSCGYMDDVQSLYTKLLTKYDKRILPAMNHDQPVHVGLRASIASINGFDELTGRLSLTCGFHLNWTDERLAWNTSLHPGVSYMLFVKEDIWRPQLFVKESMGYIQEIGNVDVQVRVTSDGVTAWSVGDVLQVSCSVDVTYFPFDTQKCTISMSSYAYMASEFVISVPDSEIDTSFTSTNSQWHLASTNIETDIFPPKFGSSAVKLTLELDRRSEFFIVYILVPISLLSFLNSLVFLMPSSCGERTSVAITTFLSFVVYMDIINRIVPQSSKPTAYIYFYLMFLMIYSSLIMFLCVISLKIHDSEGPIPAWVETVVMRLRCRDCRKADTAFPRKHVASVDVMRRASALSIRSVSYDNEKAELPSDLVHENTVQADVDHGHDEMSWKVVGVTFDRACAFVIHVLFWPFSLVTLLQLYHNIGWQ